MEPDGGPFSWSITRSFRDVAAQIQATNSERFWRRPPWAQGEMGIKDRQTDNRLPVQFVRPSVKSTSRIRNDDGTIKTTTKTTETLQAALPEEKMKYRK